MITLKSKKTGKLVIASDSESVVKDYIINRYNKAFGLLKSNAEYFPNTGIDYVNVSLDDFQKTIDSYKVNVLIWQKVYKAFMCVCPASHKQTSVDKVETEEYIVEKIN